MASAATGAALTTIASAGHVLEPLDPGFVKGRQNPVRACRLTGGGTVNVLATNPRQRT